MQIAIIMSDHEADDGKSPRFEVSENMEPRMLGPALNRSMNETALSLSDFLGSYGLLELKDKARSDGLDNGRCTAFFPVDGVIEVSMVARVDVRHCAATRCRRDLIV